MIAAAFNQQWLKPAQSLDELLVGRIQHLSSETRQAEEGIRIASELGDPIKTNLEDRLNVALLQDLGCLVGLSAGEVLEADRQHVSHFFESWTNAFKLAKIH